MTKFLFAVSLTALLPLPLQSWEIIKDGQPQAAIVLPDKPLPAESYAAEELRYILKKATGAELAIVAPSSIPDGMRSILLGRAAGLDLEGLPFCGFRIVSTADSLALAGRDGTGAVERLQTAAGTLYAVYEWAERELQVRWLWPSESGEVIPQRPSVSAGNYDVRREPALEFASVRRFDWRWNRRLLRADQSRNIRFAGCSSQGHAFIDWYKRYGAEHPEYFEMDSQGRRLNDRYASMCVSSPALHQQIVDNWRDSGYTQLAVNAKENDAYGRCQCENCQAWDGEDLRWPTVYYSSYRNVGERYAKFYQAVWEKAAQINPQVKVGGYAYMNYVYAPRHTKLNKNILVGFVDDLPFPRTKAYQDLVDAEIKAWGESGASLYLRPNYYLSSYAMPELFYNQYAHEFKLAYQNGMLGLDIDGPNNSWGTIGLNLYVMGRLVVDPERPVAELVEEYCAAFGTAASTMQQYFSYWEKYAMDNAEQFNHIHETKSERKWFIYGFNYTAVSHLLFPENAFAPALAILDEAASLAQDDPMAAERIRFIRQGCEHAQLCSKTSAIFADPDNDNIVRQKAIEQVKAYRKNLLPQVADVEFFTGKGRLESHAWKLIDVDLTQAIALPEFWQVRAETAEAGRTNGYYKPDFNDQEWASLSTWGFLEDQGLVEYRTAWYRTAITIPAERAGQRVILRLGAIDESGWFWVNGQEAGVLIYDAIINPNSWKEPQEYDVTNLVKFGEKNQITVLVENTVGKGGLWRPSYLRFEKAGTGEIIQVTFPAREGYAELLTGEDGIQTLKMIGRPDRGDANDWQTSIVPLPQIQAPGGKTYRLKADICAENLGDGEFWVVIRHVGSTGLTMTYDGILVKQDMDWTSLEKDVKVRNEAATIQLFAVGLRMPEGAAAMVKNVSIEEMH